MQRFKKYNQATVSVFATLKESTVVFVFYDASHRHVHTSFKYCVYHSTVRPDSTSHAGLLVLLKDSMKRYLTLGTVLALLECSR